ncbi:MAG TPA: LOG family protein [Anaerolineae bacterium]
MATTGIISVFGSSAPQPGTPEYEDARKVGRLLAEAGFAVATGGYSGTMAAVSQGAHEVGGHVVGVTSTRIESFRARGANEWVLEEIRFETLRDRLLHLVTHNDGMITLPGGIGTLSEMALAWSFLQVAEIETRPLVLLGDIWHETIKAFYRPEYVAPRYMEMIHFARTPEEAVAHIVQSQENPG